METRYRRAAALRAHIWFSVTKFDSAYTWESFPPYTHISSRPDRVQYFFRPRALSSQRDYSGRENPIMCAGEELLLLLLPYELPFLICRWIRALLYTGIHIVGRKEIWILCYGEDSCVRDSNDDQRRYHPGFYNNSCGSNSSSRWEGIYIYIAAERRLELTCIGKFRDDKARISTIAS